MDIERLGEKLFGWWVWLGFYVVIGLGGFFVIWFVVKGIFYFILSFGNAALKGTQHDPDFKIPRIEAYWLIFLLVNMMI